jgi:hypothetical protein
MLQIAGKSGGLHPTFFNFLSTFSSIEKQPSYALFTAAFESRAAFFCFFREFHLRSV